MFGQKPPLKKATAPWGQGEVYQPKSAHPGKLRSAVGDPVVHPKRSTPAPSKIQREARPWEQRGGTFRPKDAHTNAPKSNGNLIAHEKDSSAPSGKSKHTVEAPWGRGKEDSPKSPVRGDQKFRPSDVDLAMCTRRTLVRPHHWRSARIHRAYDLRSPPPFLFPAPGQAQAGDHNAVGKAGDRPRASEAPGQGAVGQGGHVPRQGTTPERAHEIKRQAHLARAWVFTSVTNAHNHVQINPK